MSLDPLLLTLSEIGHIIAGLDRSNNTNNTTTTHTAILDRLLYLHDTPAETHTLRRLARSALSTSSTTTTTTPTTSTPVTVALLASRPDLSRHPARAAGVREALLATGAAPATISRTLRLSPLKEAALCLALEKCDGETAANASRLLKRRLLELVQNYLDRESARRPDGGLGDCTPELLQAILAGVDEDGLGLAPAAREQFLERLRGDFPRDVVPVVLAPLLYPDETETPLSEMSSTEPAPGGALDGSLPELVRETGRPFTDSLEECRAALADAGGREISPLEVAKTISAMARRLPEPPDPWHGAKKDPTLTRSSLDRWNPEIFARALRETQPNLNYKDVVRQLDHPEFSIDDRQGLALLLTFLRCGLQNAPSYSNSFPVEYLYRHWNNAEGQLSLISTILKNPDLFCFADYNHHPVAVDALKSQPENDGKEVANWRSLNLVELLLYFADRGFIVRVQELFVVPMQHCPDVLLLALLQINSKDVPFRHELIGNLIPIFLGNHPNSLIVLHNAWHNQNPNVKTIIMQAMAGWYLRGESDQSRLSRILDVAQDLKCLSMLLNVQSFMFVLDLACLASRREYLKLDKWLTDKIRDHGESFLTTMVKFLQRRCPPVVGGKIMDDQLPKAAHLPPETIATMVNVLQFWATGGESSEMILNVINNCSLILNKRQALPANLQRPHRMMDGLPFGASGIGGQMLPTPPVDPIAALNPNFANMNLSAQGSAFTLPMVSTPGSPSRLMATGALPNSPFMPPISLNASLPNMAHPRMGQTMDKRVPDNQLFIPEISQQVSKEIEDEANGYFQKIYNHPPTSTITIDEVLDMLKKFSESKEQRNREIYSCMLRNLFEEYRFFPQYPEKELQITAQLFGGIIERGLVSSYSGLGLALKFVLEALRKPPDSKMYFFGIAALDRFKSRLKEYHKYCEHVRALDSFPQFPIHLKDYVEFGLASQEPPKPVGQQGFPNANSENLVSPGPSVANSTALYKSPASSMSSFNKIPPNHPTSRPSIANATNIDTLLVATDKDEKIIAPPEIVQEKCAFIFNNLSQLNLSTKCEELRELINEEYFPWLSQYLVMKRASIELNFHTLYSNFLDVLKIKEFNEMVTRETFRNIKVLLRSDKGIENFSDRSLLKNLGHWLGMLTLGRSRPILQIDIDLKSLILEAYHKGLQELLYVIPFLAKVLESCEKSKVFKPPNPWTMAIMNVLAELHLEHDLKLNLKFEIEVLCKNLNIEVEDLKPSHYLRNPDRIHKIEYQLSHAGKKNSTPIPIPQNVTTPTPASLISVANIIQPEEIAGPSVTPTNVMLPNEPGMVPLSAAMAKYSYAEINVNLIAPFITISPQLVMLQSNPHMKSLVRSAVERSITEWIHPVVDRSIKYALTTCEQIIRKDFALDPDENRMRTCAHNFMRNLTAGMAMITCREQLLNTISSNVKTALSSATNPQKEQLVDAACTLIATENMEIACAIIQKTAVEKGIPQLEARLMNDYEMRKLARQENRPYFDKTVLNYQNDRMPEILRMKVGAASDALLIVYEEFGRNIPGFVPVKDREATQIMPKPITQESLQLNSFNHAMNPQSPPFNYNHGPDEFTQFLNDAEQLVASMVNIPPLVILVPNIQALVECVMVIRRSSEINMALPLIQKAIEGLAIAPPQDHLDVFSRYKEIHIRTLKILQDVRLCGHPWTIKHIVRCLNECRDDYKYNIHLIDCLIRNNLIHLPSYDTILAQSIENTSHFLVVEFVVQLLGLVLSDDRDSLPINESDLPNTIDCIKRLHSRHPSHEGLASLVDLLQSNQETTNMLIDGSQIPSSNYIHSEISQARYREETTSGFVENTSKLLQNWVQIYHNPTPNSDPMKTFNIFVSQMNAHGILKTDDLVTRFFKICTQICVDNVYKILEEERLNPPETVTRSKYYNMIDAYVRLVALLIKNSGEAGNVTPKINLLNKVLVLTAGRLLQDHDDHGSGFQSLPYIRIFIVLFMDLTQPEGFLETINHQLLAAFCHVFLMIRPSICPGFCFAWIDFISHRAFLSRVLASTPQQKGWGMYSQLLVALFEFMGPFLKNTELSKPIALAYKGILKLLLVLLHDFPEFLCDYHYLFCDEIPPNCIQLRNLILSAFPRNMRLPDPFTPNLKVDLLIEISLSPRVITNYNAIFSVAFKKDLDSYLAARAPVTFLSELRSAVETSNEPGKKYNIKFMNAVVLYVGTKAIQHIRDKSLVPNTTTIAHSAHMDIFQNLAVDLDHEGRYIFLNSIANQLRYPNCHTHYFSCALLHLFAEANTEAIQEQITRMLLERLIVNRPHPWGLLITFIELIKNPTYKFWDHDFVHCAPEIEKLFESIARSCLVEKTSAKQELEVND